MHRKGQSSTSSSYDNTQSESGESERIPSFERTIGAIDRSIDLERNIKQQTQIQPQRKRKRRKALSCTQCHERKIKCDRNVPNCSSCVARGIQRTCRWGDERDEDNTEHDSYDTQFDRKRRIGKDNEENVDHIVEEVLKKINRESLPEINLASMSWKAFLKSKRQATKGVECMTRPPSMADANLIQVKAFTGSSKLFHPIRVEEDKSSEQVSKEVICQTIQLIPKRKAFETLVDRFLDEIGPFRSIFNRVILHEQVDQFWDGVQELGVSVGHYDGSCSSSDVNIFPSVLDFSHPFARQVEDMASPGYKEFFLGKRNSQGLIAVMLALLDIAGRAVDTKGLIELKILPQNANDEMTMNWCNHLHELSMRHLTMSNFMHQPTLWVIQALLLAQSRWLDSRASGRNVGLINLAISLAVNMGLNRLGSAYDDLDDMLDKNDKDGDRATSSKSIKAFNTDGIPNNPTILTDARYGATISIFEEGNIALRELGRKVWCSLVTNDFLIAGHLDHFYTAHDSINHTASPVPISDSAILSPEALILLAKARRGQYESSENEVAGIWLLLARAVRTQTDLQNIKGLPLIYEDVLTVDDHICEVIDLIPESLQFKKTQEIADKSKYKENIIRTILIHDQIHFRRLRLHRLQFGKGLKNKKYRRSTIACLNSAREILAARAEIAEHGLTIWSTFIMQSHLFHATLILQLVLLYEMDRTRSTNAQEKYLDGLKDHNDKPSKKFKSKESDVFVLDNFDLTLDQLDQALRFMDQSEIPQYTKEHLPGINAFLEGVKLYRSRQKITRRREPKAKIQDQSKSKPQPPSQNHVERTTRSPIEQSSSSSPTILRTSQNDSSTFDTTPDTFSISSQSPQLVWPLNAPFQFDTGSSTSNTFSNPNREALLGITYPSGISAQPLDDQMLLQEQPAMPTATFDMYDPTIWSLEALFPDYAAGEVDLVAALERSIFSNPSAT